MAFYFHGLPIGWVAIMLALLASMGGFIFGYDTGQISDILLMDDFLLRFATCSTPGDVSTCSFSTVREGLIVCSSLHWNPRRRAPRCTDRRLSRTSLCHVRGVHGVYHWSRRSDSFKRRLAAIRCRRFIGGLGVGALSAAVPMYQAETAPPQIRGTLTATYQLFITFGILVAYCISIGTRNISNSASWRIVVGIGILWALILGIGILFMPESPRMEEAQYSMARSRGIPKEEAKSHYIIVREVEEIKSSVQYEKQDSRRSLQQLTGANYFFYYGATVFKAVGLSDSFVTQIILGSCQLCLHVRRDFGRRKPLIIGGIWQSAWLFVFAAAGSAVDPTTHPGIGKLMIVSACMFIWGYAMTWAPGVWILIGETFPTRTRAKQGSLSTAANWVWNFLLAFFTPFISSAISYRYGFVFAACNLTGAVVVYFFLYESSNLSLESVNMMYTDPNCKPWTSSEWAPPGYSSRQDLIDQTRAAEVHKPLSSGALEEGRIEKRSESSADGS
ncbi:hypothetical protein EDB19DRAFT_1905180 [Suillus lakei]|nr:hypothetical protein EDB19DRAFT_1905180 [Suillus lakei]